MDHHGGGGADVGGADGGGADGVTDVGVTDVGLLLAVINFLWWCCIVQVQRCP